MENELNISTKDALLRFIKLYINIKESSKSLKKYQLISKNNDYDVI